MHAVQRQLRAERRTGQVSTVTPNDGRPPATHIRPSLSLCKRSVLKNRVQPRTSAVRPSFGVYSPPILSFRLSPRRHAGVTRETRRPGRPRVRGVWCARARDRSSSDAPVVQKGFRPSVRGLTDGDDIARESIKRVISAVTPRPTRVMSLVGRRSGNVAKTVFTGEHEYEQLVTYNRPCVRTSQASVVIYV